MSAGTEIYAFLTGFFHKSKPSKLRTPCFYGRANYWHEDRKTLCKELNAMADANLTGYLIELAGMGSTYWSVVDGVDYIRTEYKWLLKQARRRNLGVFVSIVNDNLGRDGGKRIGDYGGIAEKFGAIVGAAGPKGVFVQPVAEIQTSYGRKFDAATASILHAAGFKLVYNGDGGRPSKKPAPYDYAAYHYGKSTQTPPKGGWCVSDHSLLIRELNGGPIDGHGVPAKVSAWAKTQSNAGAGAIGYYAYKVHDFDKGTIKALSSGLSK